MTFGAVFQRPFPPVFDRGLDAAAAAAGWWVVAGKTCVAAYQPKGAASLAASYVNLANPGTYDAAPGTAPTFNAATGWTFDGASSQYLITGIVPVNNQTWSMIVRFSDADTAPQSLAGVRETTPAGIRFHVDHRRDSNTNVYFGSGGVRAVAAAFGAGTLGFAGNQGYKNGLAIGTTIPSAAGTFTRAIWIGGTNTDGTLTPVLTGKIQAVAIYSDTLSAGEVATVSSAMAAL